MEPGPLRAVLPPNSHRVQYGERGPHQGELTFSIKLQMMLLSKNSTGVHWMP